MGEKDQENQKQPCGMCHGNGGRWETADGQTPGKSLRRWVACPGCGGSGEK